MEEILLQLGLTDNESAVYLLLLKAPRQTAQQLADQTDVKRTNMYRILDNLLEQELIVRDDSPVSKFSATEPQQLQKILEQKQLALKQTARSLSAAMPSFRSQYSLSMDKPGVYHMAGHEGIERLLTDMVTSSTEVLLVASNDIPEDETTLNRFVELLMERRDAGVNTRALFHDGPHRERIQKKFTERGFETRFVESSPFKGEVVIYEDNVAFTVYDPSIIVTVLTNQHIAATMRTMFEQVWLAASH
jgi:sugar-specific transcriptional regulator TrmB